jgi:hypothetical protein
MFDDILEIIGHPSIHNIEEVISLWKPSLGELIGEVPHEVSVLLEVRP